jgi:hypothetical protein
MGIRLLESLRLVSLFLAEIGLLSTLVLNQDSLTCRLLGGHGLRTGSATLADHLEPPMNGWDKFGVAVAMSMGIL